MSEKNISFVIGQRWISEMEPELGLGRVTEIIGRKVQIQFPASDCERLYATETAPLKRVQFKTGDEIQNQTGKKFTVTKVNDQDGLLNYLCDKQPIPESELSDSFSFTTPKDRLLNGLVDPNSVFNLRYQTLKYQSQIRKSKVRGFIGGRIDLIPHQFYIADQIVSRYNPRVLLADEVGLGKTIEACLILHRLLLSGRINRVLILVPESLVHQWFVELLRRFNLLFRIFNEEYCLSIEESEPDTNPFLENQIGICDLNFLLSSEKRKQQAFKAGWDMLVVDEAHHLTEKSSSYQLVEELGKITPGLILLTATPEQMGLRSHFERLHLLDPARYNNYKTFLEETNNFQEVAQVVNKIVENKSLSQKEQKQLEKILQSEKSDFKEGSQEKIIGRLLDQHGPGRVMFRNTRNTISGFPKRVAHLEPLSTTEDEIERLNSVIISEYENKKGVFEFSKDSRIPWLVEFLKKKKDKKILLICHSIQKVMALDSALRGRINIKAGLFHEKMTLIQRDRNAAWFSEKDGAQILICSEIGSEGRNFQFAHHLVLFDLPFDPELLEQRIGRLDRIGQTKTIQIYVPFIKGSIQEILAKWFHDGLNAFEKNVPGVYEIYQKFKQQIETQIKENCENNQINPLELDKLIQQTKSFREQLILQLEKGRDRLLDLNSFRPKVAEDLLNQLQKFDSDHSLEKYMLTVFNFYGIRFEDMENRSYQINFELLKDNVFPIPLLRERGLIATFDRKTANKREDYEFLNWDHPMVIGAMELITGSEQGNSCFVRWQDSNKPGIYLEAVFILEAVAPLSLQVDRFFPATPVRVIVNHSLENVTEEIPFEKLQKGFQSGQPDSLLENSQFTQELFPGMLKKCGEIAEKKKNNIIKTGIHETKEILGKEVLRLKSLKRVNPNIRDEEITLSENELKTLQNFISSARLRLDSLRLIWCS